MLALTPLAGPECRWAVARLWVFVLRWVAALVILSVVLVASWYCWRNGTLVIDAEGIRADYQETLEELRERYRKECLSVGADYVALDTSMPFDKALLEYLSQRKTRF